jgi:poly(hydroxyalkanoate) depolymerase family esterase
MAAGAVEVVAGAQFLSRTHRSEFGSRDYRLYVPAARDEGAMPLIVMLHGCTQTPEDFARGTAMNALAEAEGCLVAWPAQPSGANAQKCWNWFRPEDQRRGRGEPALLAGIAREIQAEWPVDAGRTYVAGLSAGAAAAIAVAAAYPDVFAAVGVHSGLPLGAAHDVPSAFSAMRSGSRAAPHKAVVPTIVFHGLADATVHPANGAASVAQALHAMPGLRETTWRGAVPGGQAYRVTAHARADGRTMAEHWEVEGAGHAWAGGRAEGSFTDPKGPDASGEMVRFFLQHAVG